MACKDMFGNNCDRLVRVHVRQVQSVNFDVLDSIKRTQKLFGQHGFALEIASSQSIHMDSRSLMRLMLVETTCIRGRSSPDQAELFSRFGIQDLNSITAFFVQALFVTGTFNENNGCAAHARHLPAVFVARDATPYTLAHELGHVLLGATAENQHMTNDTNIMSPTFLLGTESPSFTPQQVAQMRRSAYAIVH